VTTGAPAAAPAVTGGGEGMASICATNQRDAECGIASCLSLVVSIVFACLFVNGGNGAYVGGLTDIDGWSP